MTAEASFYILGEVYLCNLISLVSVQKTCEDSGIIARFHFYEDRIPSIGEMCKQTLDNPHSAFAVICPGNAGFGPAQALEGLLEGSGKGRVPVALRIGDDDMTATEELFYSISREGCQQILDKDPEQVTQQFRDLGGGFKALVEYTFKGQIGQRNFLKIR